MRQLHPVSTHEKFVASGIYKTCNINDINAKLSDDVEQWAIHELPDQSQLIRVDRQIDYQRDNEATESSITLLFEVLRNAFSRLERIDVHLYYRSDKTPDKRVKATFVFFEDYVQISRSFDNLAAQQTEMALPKDYVIYPYSNVLYGFAIAETTQKTLEEVPIFHIGGIYADLMNDNWLLNMTSSHAYTFLHNADAAPKVFDIGHQQILGRRYDVVLGFVNGNHYNAWLDEHNVVLKLDEDDGEIVCSLSQYARRVEPKAT